MKLVSFSAQKYRSITQAYKLPLTGTSILIGPNNEGKSNILRGLAVALRVVANLGQTRLLRGRVLVSHALKRIYDWEKDFPVSLQNVQPDGESIFNLEFELTPAEIDDFWKEVNSSLNGTLPIQISLGKKEPGFKVLKRGPGGATLSSKAEAIAQFIGKRIDFEYIEAVRTAKSAQNVVDDMVEKELSQIESDGIYKKALSEIKKLQEPFLEKISKNIKETLVEFLPAVKDVKVNILEEERHRALRRSCEIIIDDGTPTNLKYKGDGVQSLAALSLMRHASERGAGGRHLILAIEEPESHLHPRAIHQLKNVLQELADKHQVIMTSHCPLFVNRIDVSANIIVTGNKARPAKTIREIRDMLGVRAADNLSNAEIVLLVEGEDDRKSLRALLSFASPKLKHAINNNTLVIDSLIGGANLSYKLSLLRDLICQTHSFLDHDDAGIKAAKKAQDDGLLRVPDVTYAVCQGLKESEIEDMYDPQIYTSKIQEKYGVTVGGNLFKNNKKKWSDRVRDVFKDQGKHWDDAVEKDVKNTVAETVILNPQQALNDHKRQPFDALVNALQLKVANTK